MSQQTTLKMMVYGFIVAEQLFIAGCFYRFWRSSRERIFAFFTAGFLVMAVHRIVLGFTTAGVVQHDAPAPVFLIRLLSYLLIFAGVVAKNVVTARQER